MRDDERYRRANAWVEAPRGFDAHASSLGLVNGGLLLDLLTSPASRWFLRPLVGRGRALAAHALGVFSRRAGEVGEGRRSGILALDRSWYPSDHARENDRRPTVHQGA